MATFVLIHGAWHGRWCWDALAPLMVDAGHRVIAPDLPGMGEDTTPFAADVVGQWTDFVTDIVCAADTPVMLVGHSRAGLVISQVAERVPARIARLVYLAAYLLPDGVSINDVVKGDASAGPGEILDINRESGLCTVKPGTARDAFYHLCTAHDAHRAQARLVPEPTRSFLTPARISMARFGTVPRAYIEAGEDRAISLSAQRAMHTALPCDRVVTVPSDHSPFLSAPGALARVLLDMA